MSFSHPDYTIVRELGRGGSAAVFLAVQKSLNRRVAIKVLHGFAGDPQQGQRFLREGRIVAKLNHPHIVPVYDVGTLPDNESTYFMSMEYLPGGSLTDRSDEFTLSELFTTVAQICDALAYAHTQGFVHRDVKPDNILFRKPGEALLADFGIARATESQTRMTMTGAMLGTPDYMSPEQVAGNEIDHRSDLYSLGIVLFELLTGYRPLQGDTVMSMGLQQLAGTPLPLPENVAYFQPLIDRLLAKKPDERLANAELLAERLEEMVAAWHVELERPVSELYTGAAPQQAPITSTLVAPPKSRSRLGWIAAAAGVLAVGGGVYFTAFNADDTPAPQAQELVSTPAAPTELELKLADAEQAFRLDRWFGDNPDTASTLYREALLLDPGNQVAEQMLADMFETSERRALNAIEAGDFELAGGFVDDLSRAWPEDARVAGLRDRLGSARRTADEQASLAQTNQQVAALLNEAEGAMARGALLDANGPSAVNYFRRVLALDPGNMMAQSGMANVANRLFVQIESALAEGDLASASALLADVGNVSSDQARLNQLQDRIETERASRTAAQAAQADSAKLAADIGALSTRIDAWVTDDKSSLDVVYESLSADMSLLLQRDPENAELLALRSMAQRHADRLARMDALESESEAESEDEDRFRFGSF